MGLAYGTPVEPSHPIASVARHQSADVVGPVADEITVERPAGELRVASLHISSAGRLDVTVVDTRADDPGWTAALAVADAGAAPRRLTPLITETAPFTAADGRHYAQHVVAGGPGSSTLARAPRGHGLGIAHLSVTLPAAFAERDVSVTVA
jgi:hypothetical protein